MKTRLGAQAGFTLLELLLVVIIIGILASIALPQYVSFAERAQGAKILPLLQAIRGSELRYKAENGAFLTGSESALTKLDVEIPASIGGWTQPTVTAVDVSSTRNVKSGGATITINLEDGIICASDGDASTSVYKIPGSAQGTPGDCMLPAPTLPTGP